MRIPETTDGVTWTKMANPETFQIRFLATGDGLTFWIYGHGSRVGEFNRPDHTDTGEPVGASISGVLFHVGERQRCGFL